MPDTVLKMIVDLVREGYEVSFETPPQNYFLSIPKMKIRVQNSERRKDMVLDLFELAAAEPSPEVFMVNVLAQIKRDLEGP